MQRVWESAQEQDHSSCDWYLKYHPRPPIVQRDLAHVRKQLSQPPTLIYRDQNQIIFMMQRHKFRMIFKILKMKIKKGNVIDIWYFDGVLKIISTLRASQWCSFPPDGWWRQALQHMTSIHPKSCLQTSFIVLWLHYSKTQCGKLWATFYSHQLAKRYMIHASEHLDISVKTYDITK